MSTATSFKALLFHRILAITTADEARILHKHFEGIEGIEWFKDSDSELPPLKSCTYEQVLSGLSGEKDLNIDTARTIVMSVNNWLVALSAMKDAEANPTAREAIRGALSEIRYKLLNGDKDVAITFEGNDHIQVRKYLQTCGGQ